jgi:hypothetical protein
MNTKKALENWILMNDIPIETNEKLAFMIGYNHASRDFLVIIKELKKELLRLKKNDCK